MLSPLAPPPSRKYENSVCTGLTAQESERHSRTCSPIRAVSWRLEISELQLKVLTTICSSLCGKLSLMGSFGNLRIRTADTSTPRRRQPQFTLDHHSPIRRIQNRRRATVFKIRARAHQLHHVNISGTKLIAVVVPANSSGKPLKKHSRVQHNCRDNPEFFA